MLSRLNGPIDCDALRKNWYDSIREIGRGVGLLPLENIAFFQVNQFTAEQRHVQYLQHGLK